MFYHRNMKEKIYLLLVAFMSTLNMAAPSFPMALYDSIYVPKTTDGVFISPVSVRAILAVAALAAKGKTKNEILQSMESTETNLYYMSLPKNVTDNSVLDTQIYVGKKDLIDKTFKNKLKLRYSFQDVEFGTKTSEKLINYSVQNVTKTSVDKIFPHSLNKNTALAAVNTNYLNMNWKTEFTSTINRGFKKPMVHQYGDFKYANLSDLNAMALELEFKDDDAKMLVLQPNDNNLQRLGDQLLNVDLTKIPKRLNSTYMSLYFPIIKEIKVSMSLKDALSTLGIDRGFTNKANFGNIVDACENDLGLYMKDLRQHTSFKSDRQRAQFAAVTGLQMDLTKNARSSYSCLQDEYVTEFPDPNENPEQQSLALRMKEAPHYYFEHKLFFALINKEDIIYIGTLAKEK